MFSSTCKWPNRLLLFIPTCYVPFPTPIPTILFTQQGKQEEKTLFSTGLARSRSLESHLLGSWLSCPRQHLFKSSLRLHPFSGWKGLACLCWTCEEMKATLYIHTKLGRSSDKSASSIYPHRDQPIWRDTQVWNGIKKAGLVALGAPDIAGRAISEVRTCPFDYTTCVPLLYTYIRSRYYIILLILTLYRYIHTYYIILLHNTTT